MAVSIPTHYAYTHQASLVSHLVKNRVQCGKPGFDPWVGKFPGGGQGNPLQYSCLENSHGQRNLEGYSPWSFSESDTTKRLSTAQHMPI